jgi:hypothetical protein
VQRGRERLQGPSEERALEPDAIPQEPAV